MKYENEEQIRKDFGRLFGWQKPRNQYDYGESEIRTPEWAEIFAGVGRLNAMGKVHDMELHLKDIEHRLTRLERPTPTGGDSKTGTP